MYKPKDQDSKEGKNKSDKKPLLRPPLSNDFNCVEDYRHAHVNFDWDAYHKQCREELEKDLEEEERQKKQEEEKEGKDDDLEVKD